MASQIKSISDKFREEALARNEYKSLNTYSSNHPNALSDGDELGKGENNGKIGGITDINSRIDGINRNFFSDSKTYPDF